MNVINMKGQRFGNLTVMERSLRRNRAQQAYWICKCDCGNTLIVRGDALRRGRSTQCSGCRNNVGRLSVFVERGGELG